MSALKNPQDAYATVHISGTNGKGSVAATLESCLRACGYKTGLYTSPHLFHLRERTRVNGKPSLEAFLRSAKEVFTAERVTGLTLTHFELLTAISFVTFRSECVQIAVVECGMGGRWDATNVIRAPRVSVITSVALDHCEYLGHTEREIAREKSGIIKSGRPVVSGVTGTAAIEIERSAQQAHARVLQWGKDFMATIASSSHATRHQPIRYTNTTGSKRTIPLHLAGSYQIANAAVALTTLLELERQGFAQNCAKRDRGFQSIQWPGRFQFVQRARSAMILIDGAHNPAAIKGLLESIDQTCYQKAKKTFIFSAFKDKDISQMASMIGPTADEICLFPLSGKRAASLNALRNAFSSVGGPVRSFKTAEEALRAALADTPKDGLVVATGSLTVVGQILSLLKETQSKVVSHV